MGQASDISDFPSFGENLLWGEGLRARRLREDLRQVVRRGAAAVLIVGEPGTGRAAVARVLHAAMAPERLLRLGNHGSPCPCESAPEDGSVIFCRVPSNCREAAVRTFHQHPAIGRLQQLQLLLALTCDPGGRGHACATAAHRELADGFAMIAVPPLRLRPEDLESLAEQSLQRFATSHCVAPPPLAPDAVQVLRDHDWPGNLNELDEVLKQAAIMSGGQPLGGSVVRSVLDMRAGAGDWPSLPPDGPIRPPRGQS